MNVKQLLLTVLCGTASANLILAQERYQFVVAQEKITESEDYIVKKVPLKYAATPIVTLENITTQPAPINKANVPNSFDPDISIVTERKKSYALLKFPKYAYVNGALASLTSFDFLVNEVDQEPIKKRPTFADNSVLASGDWFKFAIKERGVYKLDYNALVAAGINPSQINPANIRLYGNGGKMMSEEVGTPDNYDDLIENAIYVSSTGSTFTTSDYILFYADGPHKWTYLESLNKFNYSNNIYDDQSYYFLNFDIGPGKRIGNQNNLSEPSSQDIVHFDNYWALDVDSISISQLGRAWFHKRFNSNNSTSLRQSIAVNLYEPTGQQGYYDSRFAHVSVNTGNVSLSANGAPIGSVNIPAVTSYSIYFEDNLLSDNFNPQSSMNFEYRYSPNGSGNGYLDNLVLNYESHLKYNSGFLNFRNKQTSSIGAGNFVTYQIDNATDLTIWDITNPFNIVSLSGQNSGNKFLFKAETDTLREFIAFKNANYFTPSFVEKVENQNLHATNYADLIIIAPKEFLGAAQNFADYKQSKFGQNVLIVEVSKIYNEFSSGSQDISAIRNFIKMFYDRAADETEIPKGILFFGNASYDYKNRINANTNFVPTLQSIQSKYNSNAYVTDDYFALLDDGENIFANSFNPSAGLSLMDIAIGRFPINSVEEAEILLDKYKAYHDEKSYGDWKNTITFVADDHDYGPMNHMEDCEIANNQILEEYRNFNLNKIYADAYRSQQTSSGARFPLVNKAISDQIYNGTLYLSYSGHGNPERWADENILSSNDFNRWNNLYKLPFIFTGTCDFSRFDNPSINSAGVRLLKRKEGGAIALLSTTQIVYSGPNTIFSKNVVNQMFEQQADGSYLSIGEVVRRAKNENPNMLSNNLNYVLLGDPTMTLALPNYKVTTTSIKNITTGTEIETDTISALGKYVLEGKITDVNGQLVPNFNGNVYITIYDKPVTLQTLPSDRPVTPYYKVQNNIITKISATVTNGVFSTPFIVPKDILFDFGSGKISYYAHTNNQEANGYDTAFTVGGFDPNAANDDNQAPIVKAYIDNDKFKNGSIVGANPTLYATFYDDNGINISGSSLGHDLVAILDGDESAPFVMNGYYQSEINDFKNGHLYFPLYNLPEGKHTVKVRAWDVYNNSGEGEVSFEVINPEKGFIGNIYSYPNPFATTTKIVVQHNQEGKTLDFKVRIFSPSGRMVGYTEKSILANGNSTEMEWDGKTIDGKPLEPGLYFYNVEIVTSDGKSANANQKLVYLPQ